MPRQLSAEHRAHISTGLKGHVVSAETRAKLSAAHQGKQMSAAACAKMSMTRKGTTRSPEWRAKIAAALIGRPKGQRRLPPPKTPETRAKLSAANKGQKPSAAAIAASVAARVGKKQNPADVERRRQSMMGTRWSLEARRRFSLLVKDRLAKGLTNLPPPQYRYTKLAQRLHRYLEDHCGISGLEIERAFPPYRVDLYDPVTRTAFEADGTYWHRRNEERHPGCDAQRDLALQSFHGVTVVHFTDEDIKLLTRRPAKIVAA